MKEEKKIELPNSFFQVISLTCQKRKVINMNKYHKFIAAKIGAMSTHLLRLYTAIVKENLNKVKVRENHQKNGKNFHCEHTSK